AWLLGFLEVFRVSSSCQVLVASARLELQLPVEFEKVVFWSHEVKIDDLLGVDSFCIYYVSVDRFQFGLGTL
ncbi:hypothetical protein LINPERHAP1_LOCUS29876, partial [Linum perenne]